jgi:hypothetical protein
MDVWLPLRGENQKGLNPKGCYIPGWNTPAYQGLDASEVADRLSKGQWIGLRLDDWIVIDCDGVDANGNKDGIVAMETRNRWLDHIGLPMEHTLYRATRNGYHFFYRRPVSCFSLQSQKLDHIVPHLELLTGMGHQVVWTAPFYETLFNGEPRMFNPDWLPQAPQKSQKTVEEWRAVPAGMRNDFLTSLGGKVREWGGDADAIYTILAAANEVAVGLSTYEVRQIAKSVSRYEPGELTETTCPKCDFTWETL